MTFDTIQKCRLILKILQMVGLWTSEDSKNLKNGKPPRVPALAYNLLLHVPLTFTFTALMWLEVYFSSDLTQVTDVLYIALTETALVIKIVSIWYHGSMAKTLFKEWQTDEMFELQTVQEQLMWQRTFKVFGVVTFAYTICSLSVVGSAFTAVLFMSTYQLPFPMWTPFNWQQPYYYWYAFFYELFAMPLTCISNISLDMFHCYMMQHLALCCKLIAMRLEKLGVKKFETNKKITEKLVGIIVLDQKVKRMSKHCESVISYPILAQILLSALVLCFSLYRLQNIRFTEDPGNSFSLIQYAIAMNLQIFLPCYYSNKLTFESSRLLNCIYNCNWTEMSPYNRNLIFLYMQYLRKPVILRAGNFFAIGLPVYSKTMNNAYSFFALLLNMDVE